MNIGIYGGSFNPIHKGHTNLAQSLIDQHLVDELWLLVSPLNPLKQDSTSDIAAYHHRLAMAQLATQGMPSIRVSDFESHLPIPSYMVNTLAALRLAYPQHQFTLVIGADNWRDFPRWHDHQRILTDHQVLVYRRPGCDINETLLPPSVRIATTPLFDISSTQLRASIHSSTLTDQWIDKKVIDYIAANHLYE